MVLKRRLSEGGEAGSNRTKRPHLVSSLLKGLNHGRTLQESVPCLEPIIRKWVQEAVDCGIGQFFRSSCKQVDCAESRSLQLQFHSSLPKTLFTGSRIVSEDASPMKIALCNSESREIISSGPLSSLKVAIVVLNGDFGPGDREDWTTKEFHSKIVMNREGKRPLVTGELIVSLQGGVGYIRDLSFTDNSSWIRSGKFRLGAKVHSSSDEISIREAMSNAFKVKDHRGEPYRKHYPPSLDDEVWRLEQIAKDGPTHEKLNDFGISTVRDLLRLYATDQLKLRTQILHKHSDKNWDTIIKHAKTCALDDKRYIYRAAQGTGLIFNSIYDVVGVTFDCQSYHSVESLPPYQMRMVEDLKQHAYKNLAEWLPVLEPLITGYPMLVASPSTSSFTDPNLGLQGINFEELDQRAAEINSVHPTSQPSKPYEEQDNCIFELGESSHSVQHFNPTLRNGIGTSNSPGGYNPWASGENYESSQLSTDDLALDDNFQLISSAWQGNALFLDSGSHGIVPTNSSSSITNPRKQKPKTRWCNGQVADII